MSIFDGGKSFKFAEPGDSITGTIAEWKEQQQMEYDRKTNSRTDKPATYDDGNPIMELVFTLENTGEKDEADDDGRRFVYVSTTRAKKATIAAVRKVGKKVPEIGGRLTVTYTGKDPDSFEGRGKAFSVEYLPPEQVTGTFAEQPAAQPAQQVQATAPAQTAAAPVATPAAQPAAAAPSSASGDKIRELLGLGGLSDLQIATALSVSTEAVAAVRASM